jgi:hypothetical protein
MAYAQVKTMKYTTWSYLEYAHHVVDNLLVAFEQVGIIANIKKFDSETNLINTTTVANNNMPSWIASNADKDKGTVVMNVNSGYNAGEKCVACIYWEVGEFKYSYFIGGGRNSYIYGLLDTLVQNMDVETSTLGSKEMILISTHCNYSNSYIYFGVDNIPDRFIIGKTSVGFHFWVKGKDTSSYNMYAGQNILNYQDSIINLKHLKATKFPTHKNLVKTLSNYSLSSAIQGAIHPEDGDILTGKFYSFDIFIGITDGTIIGTVEEAYSIPEVRCSEGGIINVGGAMYLKIKDTYYVRLT